MDISDEKSIENCTYIIKSKDLSVLINNVGITKDSLIFRMNSDQWKNNKNKSRFKLSYN